MCSYNRRLPSSNAKVGIRQAPTKVVSLFLERWAAARHKWPVQSNIRVCVRSLEA